VSLDLSASSPTISDFEFKLFEPLQFGFQPLDLKFVSSAAVFQSLILLEEEH
jgi:hypothetical protein